jgi:hypothetical protein
MSSLQDVYDRWQNNAEFRNEFKNNPETALRNAGLELSATDLSKIKSLLDRKENSLENDELDGRISK